MHSHKSEYEIYSKKMIFYDIIGNFGNCTDSEPCGEDEGDCDHNSQCKEDHKCGIDNCRSSLGFQSQFDCCYSIEEDFCTLENSCSVDEGDCDTDDVCQGSLVCGLNNCPGYLNYDSAVDCCFKEMVGGEHFCTNTNTCGENEGDCDANNECQGGLECGVNNCPESLGFNNVDCCQGCCQKIIVTYATENLNPTYEFIYGTYISSGTDNSGRNYYTFDGFEGSYGIWWCSVYKAWVITNVIDIENCGIFPYAWTFNENICANTLSHDWKWQDSSLAGEGLIIKCWDHGK